MLWIGEGDEAKTPGSLSFPVLDNNHLRNRPEAAEVVFQSLLIGVEIEPAYEELPFFRRHGSEFESCWDSETNKATDTASSEEHREQATMGI